MNVLTSIQNFLQFINDNWTAITVIIALLASIYKKYKDFRNKSEKSNDDALVNRLFRNISHVGIVYDFDSGYPVIADCTDSYSNPNVIGRTSMASSSAFARTKASYERNNVVMVARHPAAFRRGGNIPDKFTAYRGTKFVN